MKYIAYLLRLTVVILFSATQLSCEDDERSVVFVNDIPAPSSLSLAVAVSTDNSGSVTLGPEGESVASFQIDFGDGSPMSEILTPGTSVTHIYNEGSYNATLTATNSLGISASTTQEVVVTFLPPENLMIEIVPDENNLLAITVIPSAENATGFNVFFGEDVDENPVTIGVGEDVSYSYEQDGTYEIRVIAFNGGVTTTEETVTVIIESPQLILPLDFENTTQDYGLIGFEGAESTVEDNPVSSGINTSSRVVQSIKTDGAQFFAGTIVPLEAPVDFSSTQSIKMKIYSPKAGIPVRLKLETSSGAAFVELDVNTTVINQWEELTWNFSGMDTSFDFVKLVIFFEFVPDLEGDGSTYYFDDIALAN